MSESKTAVERRTVRYRDLSELQEDAERLAACEVCTLGNWSYPQILQHLAQATHCAFDGFGFQAPWFARYVIAPMFKNRILTRGMSAGFRFPTAAKALQPLSVGTNEALNNLRSAMARLHSEIPKCRHPFLGQLASQEWVALTLRHAELHMSFVVPVKG
jgi:hypothetical protein